MLNCSIRRRIETKPITLKSMSPENASHLYGETTIENNQFSERGTAWIGYLIKTSSVKALKGTVVNLTFHSVNGSKSVSKSC